MKDSRTLNEVVKDFGEIIAEAKGGFQIPAMLGNKIDNMGKLKQLAAWNIFNEVYLSKKVSKLLTLTLISKKPNDGLFGGGHFNVGVVHLIYKKGKGESLLIDVVLNVKQGKQYKKSFDFDGGDFLRNADIIVTTIEKLFKDATKDITSSEEEFGE